MSTPKAPTLAVLPVTKDDVATGPQVLQPSGWPMPKGYANGMAADGRIVVTGGVIGWDAEGRLAVGFVAQARQALSNIAGPEVEAALLSHPAVAECGVVGAPDEARGMIVKAYVVLAADFSGDDALVTALQDHVKREIAPYKYPRAIEFVAQLPKTETGKLKRFALRQIAQAGSASAGLAAE